MTPGVLREEFCTRGEHFSNTILSPKKSRSKKILPHLFCWILHRRLLFCGPLAEEENNLTKISCFHTGDKSSLQLYGEENMVFVMLHCPTNTFIASTKSTTTCRLVGFPDPHLLSIYAVPWYSSSISLATEKKLQRNFADLGCNVITCYSTKSERLCERTYKSYCSVKYMAANRLQFEEIFGKYSLKKIFSCNVLIPSKTFLTLYNEKLY